MAILRGQTPKTTFTIQYTGLVYGSVRRLIYMYHHCPPKMTGLGDSGLLIFLRVVSSDYGKPQLTITF